MKTIYTTFAILCISSTVLLAQQSKKQETLSVHCKIKTQDHKKLKQVIIKIYEFNDFLSELNRADPNDCQLALEMNKKFVIEFSKEGYIPKRVFFDTSLPGHAKKKKYFYDMEVSLLKQTEVASMHDIETDFPIAVIGYSKKQRSFIHSEYYTRQIQLEESKLMKRNGQIN